MKRLTQITDTWKLAAVAMLLACSSIQVSAAPVILHCTINRNQVITRHDWVIDIGEHKIDGHPVDVKVPTVGGAYNQYFLNDAELGFVTSTGVRHAISRIDGLYRAFGVDGKVIWTGSCDTNN
jgi:hypothetical protein